jgi:hypothetical protein
MDLEPQHSSGINVIERRGVALVIGHAKGKLDPHHWSARDLAEIRTIQRNAVILAALAGALTGGLFGGIEILLRDDLTPAAGQCWLDTWRPWTLYLILALLVSGAEIVALYWLTLRRAARVALTAGLDLSEQAIEKVLAVGLSRAALEMPNPHCTIYGIDPYAQVPRWRLIGYALLYRLKVGATSFVLRILLRRVLARAAVRSLVPLIAIPVFAVWNALVIGWVMREVQIRAAGPVAVDDLVERITNSGQDLDETLRPLILQTITESIVRARDAHPNFVLLLTRLRERCGIEPSSIEPDWAAACRQIGQLDDAPRRLLLEIAIATAVLNGRTRRSQRELLAELQRSCDIELAEDALTALRRAFIKGQGLPPERLAAVCPASRS